MSREHETTGPLFRGTPVVAARVPPTPLIIVRDDDGELLLEVRSPTRGVRLAYELAGMAVMSALAFKFVKETLAIPVIVGIAAVNGFLAVRHASIKTTLCVRSVEIIVEEFGFLKRSQQRIPLADLVAPRVWSRETENGQEFSLLLPRAGTDGEEAISLLRGHKQGHLRWLAEVLASRMFPTTARDAGVPDPGGPR